MTHRRVIVRTHARAVTNGHCCTRAWPKRGSTSCRAPQRRAMPCHLPIRAIVILAMLVAACGQGCTRTLINVALSSTMAGQAVDEGTTVPLRLTAACLERDEGDQPIRCPNDLVRSPSWHPLAASDNQPQADHRRRRHRRPAERDCAPGGRRAAWRRPSSKLSG